MEHWFRSDMAGLSLGWREGLLVLIIFLALYIVMVLLRIRRLRRQKTMVEPVPQALEPVLKALNESAVEFAEPDRPVPDAREVAWSEAPAHMAQEAFMRGVENELAQMREELDALRGEFSALREEMRHELAQMRASQSVSPLYSDAMQMAMTGYGADVIAERCGISRAEAELVVSLVKNREH